MKREKVRLGGPERSPPTTGMVREVIPKDGIIQNQNPNQKNPGGVSPCKGGDNTPPVFGLEGSGEVETILTSWRQLDRITQREVLARMSLEQQRSVPGEAGDVELWAEAVHEALEQALGASDGASHGTQVVRRSMSAYSAWAPIAEFIEVGRLGKLRPAERYVVFQLLAKLLVGRARRVALRADIPLTVKLVAQNAVHISGIFNNAFPGYLAAGLVGSVARMLAAGKTRRAQETEGETA